MFNINELEGKRQPLTAQHIHEGVRRDCEKCPIALAVADMTAEVIDYPRIAIDVDGSDYVRFYQRSYRRNHFVGELLISGKLEDWLLRFDNDYPVEAGTLFVFRQEDEEEGEQLWLGIAYESDKEAA